MQKLKSLLLLICVSILSVSCGKLSADTATQISIATEKPTAIVISTPKPTTTKIPDPTSTAIPTSTQTINEPGMLAMFGDESHTWYSRLAFSPDGLILAQGNSSVKLWDVKTHQLIRELKFPYKGEATNILFNADGSLLAVNVSDEIFTDVAPDSHLLIWDIATGELKQDWLQEYATMSTYNGYNPEPTIYKISVNAMAFFPSSNRLVYASGNKIEIRDVLGTGESVEWSLGDKMYASEIGIRGDSEFLYILMKWYKNITFPALYRWRFKVEIWHPDTKSFRKEIKFEEVDPLNASKWLVGEYLLQEDYVKNTLEALNLSTNETKEFPFRVGRRYFNSDASLMLVVRDDYPKVILEVWDTDTWRNPYTFTPKFINNSLMVADGVFNPDRTILAVDSDGVISLWDVSSLKKP